MRLNPSTSSQAGILTQCVTMARFQVLITGQLFSSITGWIIVESEANKGIDRHWLWKSWHLFYCFPLPVVLIVWNSTRVPPVGRKDTVKIGNCKREYWCHLWTGVSAKYCFYWKSFYFYEWNAAVESNSIIAWHTSDQLMYSDLNNSRIF